MTTSGRRARVDVFATADELAHAAAEQFTSDAERTIDATGRCVVALSGGSTPRELYALLASEPYASRVEWSRIEWFWGDERCVTPNDPASNFRMVREALLDRVPVAADRVHRIRGEDEPAAAAAAYEGQLRTVFATPTGAPPHDSGARFDLVLLGLGRDGHTASLFPGQAAAQEKQRWVVDDCVRGASMWRVTLTPIVINAAARVLFLVAGSEKAATVRRVIEGPFVPSDLPAQVIAPVNGDLCWFVDAAAAAELSHPAE